MKRLAEKKLGHKPDYILFSVFFMVIVLGLIMLSSASSVLSYNDFGNSYWYVKHQFFYGFLPGLVFFWFIARKCNVDKLKKIPALFLFVSLALLVSVFVPGIGAQYGTAKSWISVFGLSLQPSEIVKLTFLFFLASWLAKNRENIKSFGYGFLPFLIYLSLVVFLMVLQPDTGTMFIIFIMSLAMFFVAGASYKHLFFLFGMCISGLFVLIKAAPYRLARLTAFINPDIDPQGIGYHIRQALIAIGSGGWFGFGFGNSRQKFQYLPEVAGDSIFAIMSEELGFVFLLVFFAFFVVMFIRMLKIALNLEEFFSQLVVVGVMAWIFGQFFLNIGAIIGMFPLTGVPLPFVSYGGTSLVSSMAGMAIVYNLSRFTRENKKR